MWTLAAWGDGESTGLSPLNPGPRVSMRSKGFDTLQARLADKGDDTIHNHLGAIAISLIQAPAPHNLAHRNPPPVDELVEGLDGGR